MRENHSDENIFIAYQVSRDHYPVLNETYRSFHGYCPQALLPDNYLDAFRVQKCERQKRRNNCYHRFAAGRRHVLLTMHPLVMTLGLREVLEVA